MQIYNNTSEDVEFSGTSMPAGNYAATLNPAEEFSVLVRQPKSRWLGDGSSLVKTFCSQVFLKEPVRRSVLEPSRLTQPVTVTHYKLQRFTQK